MSNSSILPIIMSIFLSVTTIAHGEKYQITTPIQISAFDTDEAGCVFLDNDGIMWIGSCSGLLSYDGYSFRTYKSDAYSPGILPNNYIMSLTEDHDNNIMDRYARRAGHHEQTKRHIQDITFA